MEAREETRPESVPQAVAGGCGVLVVGLTRTPVSFPALPAAAERLERYALSSLCPPRSVPCCELQSERSKLWAGCAQGCRPPCRRWSPCAASRPPSGEGCHCAVPLGFVVIRVGILEELNLTSDVRTTLTLSCSLADSELGCRQSCHR